VGGAKVDNEAHNLAGEPALESVLEELRGRHETWMHETWMHETRDPLLEGPVPAPSGAELNGRDQLSANDPTTVV
jgi:N-sulfoglucosamine sulfohydrolase